MTISASDKKDIATDSLLYFKYTITGTKKSAPKDTRLLSRQSPQNPLFKHDVLDVVSLVFGDDIPLAQRG